MLFAGTVAYLIFALTEDEEWFRENNTRAEMMRTMALIVGGSTFSFLLEYIEKPESWAEKKWRVTKIGLTIIGSYLSFMVFSILKKTPV